MTAGDIIGGSSFLAGVMRRCYFFMKGDRRESPRARATHIKKSNTSILYARSAHNHECAPDFYIGVHHLISIA